MNYLTVLIVSFALGIDAFSVALSIGMSGVRNKQLWSFAAVVTVFHVLMPLLGLSLGDYLGRLAGPMAATIGALILVTIGLSTIFKSLRELGYVKSAQNEAKKNLVDIKSLVSLVLVAASVSLDALTVGFGLGALKVDLFLTVLTMGLVAGLMSLAGLFSGRRLNHTFGEKAQVIGGLILVIIGLKLVFM